MDEVESISILLLFNRLIHQGNTVILIEHRLSLIAQADWCIDMGPEGGSRGGCVVFEGTPKGLMNCSTSKTGNYLRQALVK
ncbi:hypothetical protein AALM99_00230 [Lactococcus muris]|uniref:UvrABC system protein A n=1 Tax=Lactococcus muris TaxID=2941330 RepID=A0ABV4D535_9LACT